MNILKTIFFVVNSISTKPNHTSWCWKGHVSPLAYITLHIIYLSRVLSLLQISKFVYRFVQGKIYNKLTIDTSSNRGNVPSYFVEVYYMVWFAVLFIISKEWTLSRGLAIYFMIESFFWLMYYFFFRRFFEEKYAIMHTLEYIMVLPLLIVCQTRCISIIYNIGLKQSFAAMFFPAQTDSVYVIILSVLYTALIFGIFLSNLPIEHVKEKGNYRYNFSVIGNGNIVQNRLKQAFGKLETPRIIAVFDTKEHSVRRETYENAKLHYFVISDDTLKHVRASNILWIATPPYAHLKYLNEYINDIFVVIEKPLVTNKSELSVIKRLKNNGLWNKVFCLSYYYLEKALPLTFLYNPNTFYEKYLDLHGQERNQVLAKFEQLGGVKSIKLTLFEGDDLREWTEDLQYGGHLFETFLHLAVLARMVTGNDDVWVKDKWDISDHKSHYMSNIAYKGETHDGKVQIDLQMGKFMDQYLRQRGGKLEFENGVITIDMEEQLLEGKFNDTTKNGFRISTKEKFKDVKYSIQMDMVLRCYETKMVPAVIDGSDLQIETLSWLFEQRQNISK